MKLKRFFHAADGGADADADGAAIFLFQVDPESRVAIMAQATAN